MLVLLMPYITRHKNFSLCNFFFVFLVYNIFLNFPYSLFISEITACHQLRVLRLCSVSRFLYLLLKYFLQGIGQYIPAEVPFMISSSLLLYGS